MALSQLLALALAVPLGIICACKPETVIDNGRNPKKWENIAKIKSTGH